MKKLKIIFIILLVGMMSKMQAQSKMNKDSIHSSGLKISLRAGYDIPAFGNKTPYINYKGGLEAGASVDYYWDWIGIGFDYDYINNKPKSTYPTGNLYFAYSSVDQFALKENKITRMFYGIGPSFKYQKNNKSFLEFKLRMGLSSIKGGETELIGSGKSVSPLLLNYHAGYDAKNVFAGKASLQYNRFITPRFGFFVGAYYLQHFGAEDLVNATYKISTGYRPFTYSRTGNFRKFLKRRYGNKSRSI